MSRFERYLNDVWYGNAAGSWLRPLGALYSGAMRARRYAFQRGWRAAYRAPCPVIVVGNFTVGGAGKTPLVIEICERLRAGGRKPGVISRGYGGSATTQRAWLVEPSSRAATVGDEPLLIARRAGVPVTVCPNRRLAIECLLEREVDIVVADDGLQHLALERDANVVVVDGVRGLGNGRCLPAGPLRGRMEDAPAAHLTIVNGGPDSSDPQMRLTATHARGLSDRRRIALADFSMHFSTQRVHAVAGIGHPARFFDLLRSAGLEVIEHPFGDHARLDPSDVAFADDLPVLMTEKDAVRFDTSPGDHCFDVPVDVQLNAPAKTRLATLLAPWSHNAE